MGDTNGYAVFFLPQALEVLGEAIKPYLQDGPGGVHVVCREIDTAGALIEMTLDGQTTAGQAIQLELMVPTQMVRMIVSVRSDAAFGFGPRVVVADVPAANVPVPALPAVGPGAAAATDPPQGAPAADGEAGAEVPLRTPPQP